MRPTAVLLGAALLVPGCDHDGQSIRPPAAPTTITAPPPPPPPAELRRGKPIGFGERVGGTLTHHGDEELFEVTAPADGLLVVSVTFDATAGRIELGLNEKAFASDGGRVDGRLQVVAGLRYVISVSDGAPWDYDDLRLPFVVAATFEPAP
jgi:hypothetical protein